MYMYMCGHGYIEVQCYWSPACTSLQDKGITKRKSLRQAKQRAKIKENPELYKTYLEKDRKRKGSALITSKAQMTVKQRGTSTKSASLTEKTLCHQETS